MLFMLELHREGLVLAYHDRSDGGLYATLMEMAFASHCGLSIDISKLTRQESDNFRVLFSEELGSVLQISYENREKLFSIARKFQLIDYIYSLGYPNFDSQTVHILGDESWPVIMKDRYALQRIWSETSYRMQALRDNPVTAKQEYDRLIQIDEPPMPMKLTFDVSQHPAHALIAKTDAENLPKPRVAILREQGVNGHEEMAAAFMRAGFEAVDVTMTDLIAGNKNLADFSGMAACGGFSYGDVLGAGCAWAQTILDNPNLRSQFSDFFARPDTFGIGVCNGNQMLSQLRNIIPGASHWPTFERNDDGPFKARYSPVKIGKSNSVFLAGMEGSVIPMVSAHGEGKASGDE